MAGVYISYPFCAQKCTFCNFASGVAPRSLEAAYPNVLIEEIGRTPFHWTPETVYLGGGTPSSLPVETLGRILEAVPGAPWSEATLEAAPGSITPEKAVRWKSLGINRVSLGVQSFVRRELERTGRRHSAETVLSDVATLRTAGIENLNLDLIAGLPGQTSASWTESLDWIERLAPQHVSVYMLEVDDDSRLGKEMLLGGVRYGASDVPDDDRTADFYESAVERLQSMGIDRYEISNFARRGCESLHNLKYWKREPYLGFGADAHSFDGERRWQNVESAGEYVRLNAGCKREQVAVNAGEEKFFVGLRLSAGVEPNVDDWSRHGPALKRLVRQRLLEFSGPRLRLTDRGVMVSNEVFQEFLSA